MTTTRAELKVSAFDLRRQDRTLWGDAVRRFAQNKLSMLALILALVLIGIALIADGAGFHIPRGYLYVAMAFSAGVELLNVVARRNRVKRGALPPAH